MPRKTTILIIILAIVTSLLVFLAIRGDQADRTTDQTPSSSEQITAKPVEKTTSLTFSPAFVDLSTAPTGTTTVDIIANTNDKLVTGVQIELSYDPEVLQSVTITNPTENSLFGTSGQVLFSDVNPTTGKISYAIAIGPTDEEVSGAGSVARISFQGFATADKIQTQITFLEKTLVTTSGVNESVLKDTVPLTVNLPQNTFAPQQPIITDPLPPTTETQPQTTPAQ